MKLLTKKKNFLILLALILTLSFCSSSDLSNPNYEYDFEDIEVSL